jgi:transcription termination/antitermination protein NusA
LEKILDIADSIAYEKSLNPKDVKDAIKNALIKSANKTVGEDLFFDVEFDDEKRKTRLYQKVMVVADDDPLVEDGKNYINVSEAKTIDEGLDIGDELRYDINLEDYGRNIVNVMHRELENEIQKLIEGEIYKKYSKKEGKIVSGQVVRVDGDGNTFIEIDEIRALMPRKNRIKGESFKVGDVVKAVLKTIDTNKRGIGLELTRTSPKFLEELMWLEVPEIADEIIEIKKCARIPGERAKLALYSNSPRVDPIGTAVGVKGVRINAVSKELKNENIDVIEYSDVPELFVSRAMSPAAVKSVVIKDDTAFVSVFEGQKSKAIGKAGINIRLASMLTGYKIELNEEGGLMPAEEDSGNQRPQGSSKAALEALFS